MIFKWQSIAYLALCMHVVPLYVYLYHCKHVYNINCMGYIHSMWVVVKKITFPYEVNYLQKADILYTFLCNANTTKLLGTVNI